MPTKKQPKSPSTRRPGRPKASRRVVTEDKIEEIGVAYLQGCSLRKIARRLGVDASTVKYHLDVHLRPMWTESMRSRLGEDMAKVSLIEKICWEKFYSDAPAETHEDIEKALVGGKGRLRLVKQAVRSVKRPGQIAWLDLIRWCLDFRARIHAHYAPTKMHMNVEGELRIAGQSPSEVDQAMLRRLEEQILERRKYRQSLGENQN